MPEAAAASSQGHAVVNEDQDMGDGAATPYMPYVADSTPDLRMDESDAEMGDRTSAGQDADRDGDLDFVEANRLTTASKLWTNDGDGVYTDSGSDVGVSVPAVAAAGNCGKRTTRS